MNQPQLFDEPAAPMEVVPDAQRYELHGENRDGIGMLQSDVVAWSFEGGIWWATGTDGSITGYNFKHYFWLSFRKQVL